MVSLDYTSPVIYTGCRKFTLVSLPVPVTHLMVPHGYAKNKHTPYTVYAHTLPVLHGESGFCWFVPVSCGSNHKHRSEFIPALTIILNTFQHTQYYLSLIFHTVVIYNPTIWCHQEAPFWVYCYSTTQIQQNWTEWIINMYSYTSHSGTAIQQQPQSQEVLIRDITVLLWSGKTKKVIKMAGVKMHVDYYECWFEGKNGGVFSFSCLREVSTGDRFTFSHLMIQDTLLKV